MASAPRIFISEPINLEQSFTLSKEQSHHLSNVLRLGLGAEFEVVGSNSRVFLAQIKESGKIISAITLRELPSQVPVTNLCLIIAACKGDKNDFIIEKGTELGVSKFIFFQSEHSAGKVSMDQLERFKRKAEAAAAQSKRNRLPEIKILKSYPELKPEITEQSRIIFSLSENSRFLSPDKLKSEDVVIAIGSEGDFSKNEYAFFRELGFFEASLGESVLRSETAAIAAIASVFTVLRLKNP